MPVCKVPMMASSSAPKSLPWSLATLLLGGHLTWVSQQRRGGLPGAVTLVFLGPHTQRAPWLSHPQLEGFPRGQVMSYPWVFLSSQNLEVSPGDPKGFSVEGERISVGGRSLLDSSDWPHVPRLRLRQFVTGWQQESDAEAAAGLLCSGGQSPGLLWLLPLGLDLPCLSQPGPRPSLCITHGLLLPALQVQGRRRNFPF